MSVDLLVFGSLLLAAWGAGTVALSLTGQRDLFFWEKALLGMGLGFGVLGLGLFALGLLGAFHPAPVSLWIGVWAAAAFRRGGREVEGLDGLRPGGREEGLLLALSGLCAALTFAAAGAPPAAYDALAYHLALPKLYVERGGLFWPAWNVGALWPALMEMLAVPGLMAGAPAAAQRLHWFFGVLTGFWILGEGRRSLGRRPAAAALLLWASVPVFWKLSVVALVDLAVCFYGLMALHAMRRHAETGRRSWLVLAGLMAGLAGGVKLTGLLWSALLGAVLLVQALRRRDAARDMAAFGLPLCLLALPWLLRSFLLSGNPVWPFLFGAFGGKHWDAAQSALWLSAGLENLRPDTWLGTVLKKLRGLFLPDADPFGSWLPAAAAAAALWKGRRFLPAAMSGGAVLAGAYALWYLAWMPEALRYLAPLFPLACLGLGGALAPAVPSRRWRWAGLGILLALAGARAPLASRVLWEKSAAAADARRREEHLRRNLDIYPVCDWINRNLGQEDRVLILVDTRGFYLDRPYLWGNPVQQKLVDYVGVRTDQDLRRLWRGHGVTHVLVRRGPFPWPAEGGAAVEAFLRSAPRVVEAGDFLLLSLGPL